MMQLASNMIVIHVFKELYFYSRGVAPSIQKAQNGCRLDQKVGLKDSKMELSDKNKWKGHTLMNEYIRPGGRGHLKREMAGFWCTSNV